MPLLESAKQKVESLLETISQVRELDFPFEHSRDALNQLESTFLELKGTLDTLGPKNSPEITRNFCRVTLAKIFQLLPLIGFVASSSEISGPVEFHGPFLRLVKRAIGPRAKLVISSDWQYSPYTYIFPNYLEDLGLVMVGIPVSESDNALVTPIAGHELGHNIWAIKRLDGTINPLLYSHIITLMQGKYWERVKEEHKLKEKERLENDMFGIEVWQNALLWARAQAEETFCDLVGLYTFRESYLHAFEYLLSPWGMNRQPTYPSMRDRIATLCAAATAANVAIPADFIESFESIEQDDSTLLLEIADEAARSIRNDLFNLAIQVCESKSLSPKAIETGSAINAIDLGIPASGIGEFQTILNAGWEICGRIDSTWEEKSELKGNRHRKLVFLNELLLKSLETFEIEQLQKGDECSAEQQ